MRRSPQPEPTEPVTSRGRSPGAIAGAIVMTLVMLAIAVLAARSGSDARSADTETPSMVALGDELLTSGMLDARPGDDADAPARFRLDGIAVSAASGTTDVPFERVLRVAADHCAMEAPLDPISLARALRSPPPEHGTELPSGSGTTTLAIEREHGFVACLDRFAPPPSRGALRYVYARRDGEGARFAVVWTDTVVRLADLGQTEDDGDVTGSDVPELPRPPGARRRFSFVREDGRDQLVVYDVSQVGSELERWADETLIEAGWSVPRASGAERGERVLVSSRAGRRVHVVLRADDTMVVIATHEAR